MSQPGAHWKPCFLSVNIVEKLGAFVTQPAHHFGVDQQPSLCGGLLLSLDMSQAFDRLPRSHLCRGFDMLEVPPHLSQFFLRWLDEATYHFEHRRMPCSVTATQGVRQGCEASPLGWKNIWSHMQKQIFSMP